MGKIVLSILLMIICPFLWMVIILPLIARYFGVPFKVGAFPTYRRDQRLDKRQSFWFAGVLGWGFGFFLLGGLTGLLMEPERFTISRLLYGLVSCLVFGAVSQGDWTYPVDEEHRTAGRKHEVGVPGE